MKLFFPYQVMATADHVAKQVAITEVSKDPWDENYVSIHDFWPGLDAATLDNRARRMYVLPGLTDFPWYNINGKRALFRHPVVNESEMREVEDSVAYYGSLICEKAYRPELRSECMGIIVKDEPDLTVWFIGGGTIVDAGYWCFENHPTNPNVIALKASGFRKVATVRKETPKWALTYFVDGGNELNCIGTKTTHISKYFKAAGVESRWGEKRKAEEQARRDAKKKSRVESSSALAVCQALNAATLNNRCTATAEPLEIQDGDAAPESGLRQGRYCEYDSAYKEFVKKDNPTDWKDFDEFSYCRVGGSKMHALASEPSVNNVNGQRVKSESLWEWYRAYCRSKCVYSNPSIDNGVIFYMN
eukprot:12419210-Karenia_brevis.AAC.1